jgi:hypothetical protein
VAAGCPGGDKAPLSLHGLPPSQIAELLDCHPATVRRQISRFSREGANRPRSDGPRLGGRRLTSRIAALTALPRGAVVLAEDETHQDIPFLP